MPACQSLSTFFVIGPYGIADIGQWSDQCGLSRYGNAGIGTHADIGLWSDQ